MTQTVTEALAQLQGAACEVSSKLHSFAKTWDLDRFGFSWIFAQLQQFGKPGHLIPTGLENELNEFSRLKRWTRDCRAFRVFFLLLECARLILHKRIYERDFHGRASMRRWIEREMQRQTSVHVRKAAAFLIAVDASELQTLAFEPHVYTRTGPRR